MKAQSLLCAAALAAGISTSIAQSNVSITLLGNGSYNMIANPLNNPVNNDITNLFRSASDGDQIYRWNSVKQDLDDVVYQGNLSHTWSPHFILQPGEAIFYLSAGPSLHTIQFVGDPVQGPYTNPVPFGTIAVRGDGQYNAYGTILPVSASPTDALIGLTPADGDQIYFWNPTIQDLDPLIIPTYSAISQSWTPSPAIQPGIGFFYLRAGSSQAQWIRNTTVQ